MFYNAYHTRKINIIFRECVYEKISSKVFCNVLSNAVIVCLILMVFLSGSLTTDCLRFSSTTTSKPFTTVTKAKKYQPHGERVLGKRIRSRHAKNLRKIQRKSHFFVGGCWVAKNEDIFLTIVGSGQEIGSHGYFHKDHKNSITTPTIMK